MPRLISSQHYRDPCTVARKAADGDFDVFVTPVVIDDEEYSVVVDGHHSLSAAKSMGLLPHIIQADDTVHDAIGSLEGEDLLQTLHLGDEYVYCDTGAPVW